MSHQKLKLSAGRALCLLLSTLAVVCSLCNPTVFVSAAQEGNIGVASTTIELQGMEEKENPALNEQAEEEVDPREDMQIQAPNAKPGMNIQISANKETYAKLLQFMSIGAAVFVAFALVTKSGADQTAALEKLKNIIKIILGSSTQGSSTGENRNTPRGQEEQNSAAPGDYANGGAKENASGNANENPEEKIEEQEDAEEMS